MRVSFDRETRRRWKDYLLVVLTLGCVLVALVPLGSILLEAAIRGGQALNLEFFTESLPTPCSDPDPSLCAPGGVANAIQGTLILIALASALAVPLGVLVGILSSEYGDTRLGRGVRFATDTMVQIPSIIIGIFAFSLILEVSRLGWVSSRLVFSTITGAIALATIMVPIVARTSEEALKLVPGSIREAALALGIPRYRVTMRVVLSSARGGLITGILLSVARVAGETAPLIMTAFGSPYGFLGFDQPIEAMPLTIYHFALSPYANWISLAWGASLILVLLMLGISIAARVALRGRFSLAEVAR